MKKKTKKEVYDRYLYENKYWSKGCNYVLGIDEAGRGSWAGPISVAGVVLPVEYKNDEINDSKLLSAAKRQKLFDVIIKDAVWYQITFVPAVDVDKYNPKQATINGMKKIIEKCNPKPDVALIDAEKIQNCKIKTESIIKGDQKSISIAAASILAKVSRDLLMCEYDKKYPEYEFAKHKGYGTLLHLKKIRKYGPIEKVHRFSYNSIKEINKNANFEERIHSK